MRKVTTIWITLGLWLFISLPVSAKVPGFARLSYIQEDLLIRNYDTGAEWMTASINMPLKSKDKLWIPEGSRAEIQFPGGIYLRADEETSIEIKELQIYGEDDIIRIAVLHGRTYINYRDSSPKGTVLHLYAPTVTAVAYGPSRFKVDVFEDGYTEVSVTDGVVYVEGRHGSTRVRAGNMLSSGNDGYLELSQMRPEETWDRWNLSRDSYLAKARRSIRYLPPDLRLFSSDFDDYGRWAYTPDYGYVWTPAVADSDWAPYRTGRWRWINGDYVWVSYEPWGWAPYHYGRWIFRAGIGWGWVPPAVNAVYWSPGFVAWIYTPTYVSWVPLAPGEIYYGYGYYGPYSVNLTRVNIKTVNITNLYINARVVNAVTVIHGETFATGRERRIAGAPVNPFIASGVRVSIGRPGIKPKREFSIPKPEKAVPRRVLPPQRRGVMKSSMPANRHITTKKHSSEIKTGNRKLPVRPGRRDHKREIVPVRKVRAVRPSIQRGIKEVRPVTRGKRVGKTLVQRPPVSDRPQQHREAVKNIMPAKRLWERKEGSPDRKIYTPKSRSIILGHSAESQ